MELYRLEVMFGAEVDGVNTTDLFKGNLGGTMFDATSVRWPSVLPFPLRLTRVGGILERRRTRSSNANLDFSGVMSGLMRTFSRVSWSSESLSWWACDRISEVSFSDPKWTRSWLGWFPSLLKPGLSIWQHFTNDGLIENWCSKRDVTRKLSLTSGRGFNPEMIRLLFRDSASFMTVWKVINTLLVAGK